MYKWEDKNPYFSFGAMNFYQFRNVLWFYFKLTYCKLRLFENTYLTLRVYKTEKEDVFGSSPVT